ncbi:MAG: TFIIB-type zinc ribbon-containing protein [Candidatus Bathyarchaeia archaeon]
MKYLEGFGEQEILDILGLPPFIMERFSRKLDEYLRSKLGEVSPETLKSVCPECLEARVFFDHESGENVCVNCGLVIDVEGYDFSLSFDTTYALTSELAYGKSLGGTLGYQGIVRVLAKSPSTTELAKAGNAHLGTRARIARLITEVVEPTSLRLALRKARDLAYRYGLQSDYVFNNFVGILVKRAHYFSHIIAEGHAFAQKLPETCFWMALRRFGKENLVCRFLQENKVNHGLAVAMEELQSFLEDVRRRGRLRAKVLQAHPMLAAVP